MMPKSRGDVMESVKFNLDFINSRKDKRGPFEVTQLLSSFLLTLHLNWDDLEGKWDQLPQHGIVWPRISQDGLQQPRQAMEKLRHALAHGCIAFEGDGSDEIAAVHLWTCRYEAVDWSAKITVPQIREMLECFMKVASTHLTDLRKPKRVGDPCAS